VMKRLMNLSGAESLSAAGNIFLGQTESLLLVRPYLEKMTRSEIMCLMTGGMAHGHT
jgi:CNT family concentrative nucleoside transporter